MKTELIQTGRRAPSASAAITRLLQQVNLGDAAARQRLLNLVFDDLRRMAGALMRGERIDHTLQPTALINEAYVRLLGCGASDWQGRAHFFSAAAEVMRRILVDHARARAARKRGGEFQRVALDSACMSLECDAAQLLDIDEALKDFERADPRRAQVVKLRFFAGLEIPEIARALGVSERTVKRHWRFARAWLYRRVGGGTEDANDQHFGLNPAPRRANADEAAEHRRFSR